MSRIASLCTACTACKPGVALPDDKEEVASGFEQHGKDTLPTIEDGGVNLHLLLGRAYSEQAPASVFSDIFYADASLQPGALLPLPDDHEDRGLYVVEGSVLIVGRAFSEAQMMVFRPGDRIAIAAGDRTRPNNAGSVAG